MKKTEKKEKPTPRRCVCGKAAITVQTRSGKMVTCPDPMNCRSNLRTTWEKSEDQAIIKWNTLIASYHEKTQHKEDTYV